MERTVRAGEILAKSASAQPWLSSVMRRSLDQSSCEPASEPIKPTPRLPRGPTISDPEYRARQIGLDESFAPAAAKLSKAGEWFIRAMSVNDTSRGRQLALAGSPGCGKTHVARSIYRFAQAWGADLILAHRLSHWAALWIDWPAVAEAQDEDRFQDILYQLNGATFVAIDDVGSEADRFRSGAGASRLRRVLSRAENKWLVLTSNLGLEQLLDCYDARPADRLRACQWLDVGEVPSYRPNLKAA